MEFIQSRRGNEIMIYEGYLYHKKHTYKNGHSNWTCSLKKKHNCYATVVITGSKDIIKYNSKHTHEADDVAVKHARIVGDLRKVCAIPGIKTSEVISSTIGKADSETKETFGKMSTIRRRVQKAKHKLAVKNEPLSDTTSNKQTTKRKSYHKSFCSIPIIYMLFLCVLFVENEQK
ncbi:hypothetical protein SNEBB_011116 [Seison nebaliae]|nr:hypothetical protein SNEBB_011116 [Seison nebaliae]